MLEFIGIQIAVSFAAILIGAFLCELHFKSVAKTKVVLDESGVELYSLGSAKWGSVISALCVLIAFILLSVCAVTNFSQNMARNIENGQYERVVKTTTTMKDGYEVKTDSIVVFMKKRP